LSYKHNNFIKKSGMIHIGKSGNMITFMVDLFGWSIQILLHRVKK